MNLVEMERATTVTVELVCPNCKKPFTVPASVGEVPEIVKESGTRMCGECCCA